MKSVTPRISSLREMLVLEEKRASLQSELDSITDRMSRLQSSLFSSSTSISSGSQPKSKAASQDGSSGGKSSRGAIKEKIMSALQTAGEAGLRVKDLATMLDTKAVNVYSWFHSNLKKNPSIEKVSGGHYRYAGGGESSSAESGSNSDTARSPKRKGRGQGTKRGALSTQVLKELEAAGPEGIAVRDLADKLGAKYKNIYIWFATTGKKNTAVEKVGPATYRLAA